jgi:hypothetical protein
MQERKAIPKDTHPAVPHNQYPPQMLVKDTDITDGFLPKAAQAESTENFFLQIY